MMETDDDDDDKLISVQFLFSEVLWLTTATAQTES